MAVTAVVMMMPWWGLTRVFRTVRMRVALDFDAVMVGDFVGHMFGLIAGFRRRMKRHRRHKGDNKHQAEGADQLVHEASQATLNTANRAISQRVWWSLLQRDGRSQHFFSATKSPTPSRHTTFATAEPPNCFMNSPVISVLGSAIFV